VVPDGGASDTGPPDDASADGATDAVDEQADAQPDVPLVDGGQDADADSGPVLGLADTAPEDSGLDAGATDSTIVQDAAGDADGSVDATIHDATATDTLSPPQDSGLDAPDTSSTLDSGTITCTTTRQIAFAGGCTAMVTVENDVGLFPVNLPTLGWAGGLGTNSSGISELYTNNSVPNPSQQLFLATDESLTIYVGYTMIPGDGGPDDWGTALRTDNEITSFTLNATRQGTLPPNCNIPEIAVQCSGRTTIGCQWYGLACGGSQSCCPDSIFTPVGDAGPWPVACTANTCCNPRGQACNSGVACCSGVCGADGDSAGATCL
jgi:hypothetical protein